MLVDRRVKRGDTIVEVLFAIAIFGFIVMSTMAIMQQGTNAAQLSLEISLVRNHMNSQAEAIRFVNSAIQARQRDVEAGESSNYSSVWQELVGRAGSSTVSNWDSVIVNSGGRQVCAPRPDNSFVLDVRNLTSGVRGSNEIEPARVFPRLVYLDNMGKEDDDNAIKKGSQFERSEGIWVQVAKYNDSNTTSTAYDFHIRACWESPGRSLPIKLGTIVRVHVAEER